MSTFDINMWRRNAYSLFPTNFLSGIIGEYPKRLSRIEDSYSFDEGTIKDLYGEYIKWIQSASSLDFDKLEKECSHAQTILDSMIEDLERKKKYSSLLFSSITSCIALALSIFNFFFSNRYSLPSLERLQVAFEDLGNEVITDPVAEGLLAFFFFMSIFLITIIVIVASHMMNQKKIRKCNNEKLCFETFKAAITKEKESL